MSRHKALYGFLLCCLMLPALAHANVYSFSYTGTGISASGTISVSNISGNEWLITGITGQRNGDPIIGGTNGLQPSPLADNTTLDDIIYFVLPAPTSTATFTLLTGNSGGNWTSGFAIQTAAGIFQPYSYVGGCDWGPCYSAGQYEYQEGTYFSGPFVNTPITFTITAIPEPGFYGALALGLSGLVAAMIRRRKSA